MLVTRTNRPSEMVIEGFEDLDRVAQESYLLSVAQQMSAARHQAGFFYQDMRIVMNLQTDIEINRALTIATADEDAFVFLRLTPDNLLRLSFPQLQSLAEAYFSTRNSYLEAEYNLITEIKARRVKNLEQVKSWSGWPSQEVARA